MQLRWFAAAAVVSFAVPFIFSSLLGVQHDVYPGIYFVVVLVGFAVYALATGLDLGATLRRHWRLGVAWGIVFGVALVRNVYSETATPHPHGGYYVFELIWRGGIYGAVDALLLTVLPCLVAYRALAGSLELAAADLLLRCVTRASRDDHGDLSPRFYAIPQWRHRAARDRQRADLDANAAEHQPDGLDRRPYGNAHLRRRTHLQR